MINEITLKTSELMNKCVDVFQNCINNIRTGRVSPELLNNIYIEYFSSKTPLRKISNIIIEDHHTLKINVFDSAITPLIIKSIVNANIGLNPIACGKDIRVPIPTLTEERRKKLIKTIKYDAEKSRVSIRNIRRNANEKIKICVKNKVINEDKERVAQTKIQIITDKYIKKIDLIMLKKEKELMIF